MKQFFVPQVRSYNSERLFPNVCYISKVDVSDMPFPRIMHVHEHVLEVLLITSGTGTILINEQLYTVRKGDIVIYNSGVLHEERFTDDAVSLYCAGITDFVEKNYRLNSLISDKVNPIFQTNELYEDILALFQTAFSILESERKGYPVIVQSLIGALLHLLRENVLTKDHLMQSTKDEDKIAIVLEIKDYMDQNFYENFQLKNIQKKKKWKISEYYFAHKFKEFFNYSPIEYLVRRRIGEAQTLLINTKRSITDISSQVGFNSSAYFATQFKKIVGLSPKDYRKAYTERKKQDNESDI